LHLDNETNPWIEATLTDLLADEWNRLMATSSREEVLAIIEKNEDGWAITHLENLSFFWQE
jgi:hypothetical protein